MKKIVFIVIVACVSVTCTSTAQKNSNTKPMEFKVQKTDAQWKAKLGDISYYILRQKGTERPGSGEYNLLFKEGTYTCKGCGTKLFESNSKFNAHCGWPSFDDAIEGTVLYKTDKSLAMQRTEILCAKCGGHLGHVFNDGPTKTGKRYCVNSASLDFEEKED